MNKQKNQLLNRIIILRAELGITQKVLAEKVNVSRQTISSIEKKRYTPSLLLAFKISKVFNLNIEEVFQYKE